mmetsp:Transcript_15557/g.21320  ORF Transcript_15557/g.21320 Transcript_15557/m.21320 type:complete len:305 (-) Transcript_15557:2093-3007(-)
MWGSMLYVFILCFKVFIVRILYILLIIICQSISFRMSDIAVGVVGTRTMLVIDSKAPVVDRSCCNPRAFFINTSRLIVLLHGWLKYWQWTAIASRERHCLLLSGTVIDSAAVATIVVIVIRFWNLVFVVARLQLSFLFIFLFKANAWHVLIAVGSSRWNNLRAEGIHPIVTAVVGGYDGCRGGEATWQSKDGYSGDGAGFVVVVSRFAGGGHRRSSRSRGCGCGFRVIRVTLHAHAGFVVVVREVDIRQHTDACRRSGSRNDGWRASRCIAILVQMAASAAVQRVNALPLEVRDDPLFCVFVIT